MKHLKKVKKSSLGLGLSKSSKNTLKSKKKVKVPLTTQFNKVVQNYVSEFQPSKDSNVAVVDKKKLKRIEGSSQQINSKKKRGKKNKKGKSTKYIDKEKALVAVQALLQHCKSQKKSLLFEGEETPVFAQFEAVVIPTHPKTTLRIKLAHNPNNKLSDVLLIITDEKKHHRKLRHDDEMYIINYADKLKELGVTEITKVMTLRQVRAEYYTHEMRRKLCGMYDVFLVDGKIAAKLSSLIGKKFYECRKVPIPVDLHNERKVRLEIEQALRKTQIVLKSTSCTNSVCRIGHTNMTPEELSENLEALSIGFDKCKYPGGWKNIQKVHIKTPTSVSFPVYYSLISPSEIGNVELKQTLPKKCVSVKGELSTIGRDVIVRPDGTVEVEGVDDIKSLMHELYRHAGFKDKEGLDLTDVEYKELMKEMHKRVPSRKEIQEREAERVGQMIVDDGEDSADDDSDGGPIEGEVEKDVKLKEDFEDDQEEDEAVEESYLNQWEQEWRNRKDEDDDEKDEANGEDDKKGKGKKSKKKSKNNGKRKQKDCDEEDDDEDGGDEEERVVYSNDYLNMKKKKAKDKEMKSKMQDKKQRGGKKDTPLRGNKLALKEAIDVKSKKKLRKKKGNKAHNFIPL